MSSACTSPPRHMKSSIARRSLQDECLLEAERYKWCASERAGADCGTGAMLDWVRMHWNDFLRYKWLEHLRGINLWIELREEDFGLLEERFQNSPYIDEIIRQLLAGGENLTIINWAIDHKVPMEPIEEILLAIDINSCRIKCELERSLAGIV